MMKRLFILFTIFLSYASTTLQAQDNLPQNFSISLGGGVTLPRVEGNRNDFFSKNGDRAGYNLMTEGRYYFMPNFALGLQYDYLRVARLPDKMHLHYIPRNYQECFVQIYSQPTGLQTPTHGFPIHTIMMTE